MVSRISRTLKLFVRPLVQALPIHESCEVIKSCGSLVYRALRAGFDVLYLALGRDLPWRSPHERVLWLFGSHFAPKQRGSRIILSCEIGRFKNSLSSQASSSPIIRVNWFVCLGTCVCVCIAHHRSTRPGNFIPFVSVLSVSTFV